MVTLTAPATAAPKQLHQRSPTAGPAPTVRGPRRCSPVRDLNQALHDAVDGQSWTVASPGGKHSLAVGISAREVT